jgi:transposase
MTKKKYTTEFKIQALELVKQTGSYSEAARQLGIGDNLLHAWRKKYNFSLDPKGKDAAQAVAEAEEVKRLRKQVLELEKANYILKRAAAFFSQDLLK